MSKDKTINLNFNTKLNHNRSQKITENEFSTFDPSLISFPNKKNLKRSSSAINHNNKYSKKYKDPLIKQIFNIMSRNTNLNYSAKKIMRNYSSKIYLKQNEKKKLNKTMKVSDEMAKKFYIKNREAMKGIGKTNGLFSGVIKDPRKLRNKIMLDYKNVMDYDEEDLLNNKLNYERNLEYFGNQYKIRENQTTQNIKQFYKLKNREVSFNSLSKPISCKKFKIRKSTYVTSLKNFRNFGNKTSLILENTTSCCLNSSMLEDNTKKSKMIIKKILNKKIKNKSETFCQAINEISEIYGPFQFIDEEMIKKNLNQKIYINKPNVGRIIKMVDIINKGFDVDNIEEGTDAIKKNIKQKNDRSIKTIKATLSDLPKLLKNKNFNKSTIKRFNQLQGKNFGLPC